MVDFISNPDKNGEYTAFNFTWIKIATLAILGYYISEMTSIIFNIFLYDDSTITKDIFSSWMIIDTVLYSLALIFLAIQVLIWRNTSSDYETRSKSRLAFIMLILTAFFATLYDVQGILQADLQYSHQSDNVAPFIFMFITHFYSFMLIKQLVTSIGRSKSTRAGTSIFYSLFGLNPAIRNLLWFVILVFSMEYVTIFTFYGELVMVYLSAVVAVGFTVAIWKDARRIRIGYLLKSAEKDKVLQKEENVLVLTDHTLYAKQEQSLFCKNCGIRIDSEASKCPKCGHTPTVV